MITCKKIRGDAFEQYITIYESLSGLSIPYEYLESNHVYGIFIQGKMIGGYILANGHRYRTIDFFANNDHKPKLYSMVQSLGKCLEICCFWIDYSYRKNAWINAFVWLSMAVHATLHFQYKHLLFGTNCCGLAKMYAHPTNSILIHKDHIGHKETFIFLGKRIHLLAGILSILYSKFTKTAQHRFSLHKLTLTKLFQP